MTKNIEVTKRKWLKILNKIDFQEKRLSRLEDIIHKTPICEDCKKETILAYICPSSELIQVLMQEGKIKKVFI